MKFKAQTRDLNYSRVLTIFSSDLTCWHSFFDPKWPSFELDLDFIGTNILSKFHQDWVKTVTSRVLTNVDRVIAITHPELCSGELKRLQIMVIMHQSFIVLAPMGKCSTSGPALVSWNSLLSVAKINLYLFHGKRSGLLNTDKFKAKVYLTEWARLLEKLMWL